MVNLIFDEIKTVNGGACVGTGTPNCWMQSTTSTNSAFWSCTTGPECADKCRTYFANTAGSWYWFAPSYGLAGTCNNG